MDPGRSTAPNGALAVFLFPIALGATAIIAVAAYMGFPTLCWIGVAA